MVKNDMFRRFKQTKCLVFRKCALKKRNHAPKNQPFLSRDTDTYVCISRGKKCQLSRKLCVRTEWMISISKLFKSHIIWPQPKVANASFQKQQSIHLLASPHYTGTYKDRDKDFLHCRLKLRAKKIPTEVLWGALHENLFSIITPKINLHKWKWAH